MKSGDAMAKSIAAALELVFGDKISTEDSELLRCPSSSTMSRATFRLDMMHMIMRRQQWANTFREQSRVCITLCPFDANRLVSHSRRVGNSLKFKFPTNSKASIPRR